MEIYVKQVLIGLLFNSKQLLTKNLSVSYPKGFGDLVGVVA